MNLQELIDKLPAGLKPVAIQYGTALLAMTADEIWAWIELLIAGDTAKAYQVVVDRLPPPEKLLMAAKNLTVWDEANVQNVARMALQREAATAVLKALLAIALALVGL